MEVTCLDLFGTPNVQQCHHGAEASVSNAGYGSNMYNSGYGSGMYGGLGGSYGGGLYGNNMYSGYGGGFHGGSGMYGGSMYSSGLGGPMGGYGMGMGGPYGNQDPNNPYGPPSSPPGFWMSFLRVVSCYFRSKLLNENCYLFSLFFCLFIPCIFG